jgi:hypothetical protein
MSEQQKPFGLLVLLPTRGAISVETFECLRHHIYGPHIVKVVYRKGVVEARNELAQFAREVDPEKLPFDPKYCLLTDDDHWWASGYVAKCVDILETNPDVDMVGGIYSLREVGVLPCLYTFDPATPDARSQ